MSIEPPKVTSVIITSTGRENKFNLDVTGSGFYEGTYMITFGYEPANEYTGYLSIDRISTTKLEKERTHSERLQTWCNRIPNPNPLKVAIRITDANGNDNTHHFCPKHIEWSGCDS